MANAFEDFAHFVKDNWFMAIITVVAVVLMWYFLASQFGSDETVAQPRTVVLPQVPHPNVAPVQNLPAPEAPVTKPSTPTPSPSVIVVPVRPAQMGVPDIDKAREAAFAVINAIPEISTMPKSVKAGFFFYVVNPDGSTTDLPESNLSFTLEGGGRLRQGIVSGANVKIRMPAFRLEDLQSDFCQGLKDVMSQNEVEVDLSSLAAVDKIALVSALLPVGRRCGVV